jgi:hypothetical protein
VAYLFTSSDCLGRVLLGQVALRQVQVAKHQLGAYQCRILSRQHMTCHFISIICVACCYAHDLGSVVQCNGSIVMSSSGWQVFDANRVVTECTILFDKSHQICNGCWLDQPLNQSMPDGSCYRLSSYQHTALANDAEDG